MNIQHEKKRQIRTKRVEVKLSEAEYKLIKDKNISSIAKFLRESALSVINEDKTEPSVPVFSKLEKDFVLELSRIGNNVNQIAKAINTNIAKDEPLDALKLLNLLIGVDETLRSLKESVR